jgi:acyl carrier protein
MKSETDILKEVNEVFKKVFQNEAISIRTETCASDVEEWDSLHHAMMISAIEKHFSIRFNLTEILNFKTVGDICTAIEKKLN